MSTSVHRAPDAARQIEFLRKLQRILEEGQFTATYKFALVHALADLAVQYGDDSGAPLHLPVRAIAERFVELYWRQVAPWPGVETGTGRPPVLAQNTGRQAAVVRQVREARSEFGDRLDRLRAKDGGWEALATSVDQTIRKMPLFKLQRVGREPADEFLYLHRLNGRGADATIELKPGIAFCFRAFHPLVLDLVRGSWIRFVRKLNLRLLGERTDLGEFLFGVQRSTLEAVRSPLADLQDGRCFYCHRELGRQVHVDHFIPWSRYPVDLGHNFVVAHDRCNSAKSDHLSAPRHLENWAVRNERFPYELPRIFREAGTPHELSLSRGITRWAYQQVADRQGLVWEKGRTLVPLRPGWESLVASN